MIFVTEKLFIKVGGKLTSPSNSLFGQRYTTYLVIGKFRPEGMRSLFATVNNFDLENIFGLIFRYICKKKPLPIYTYNAIPQYYLIFCILCWYILYDIPITINDIEICISILCLVKYVLTQYVKN